MSDTSPVVRLDLPAEPGGVSIVRQALVGVADGLALDSTILSDAKMAVTEACTNCVLHAFPESAGRFTVAMYADEAALTVVVGDAGAGMQEDGEAADTAQFGLGLALIVALSDDCEINGRPGAGTEVSMRFAYERSTDPAEEHPITGGPDATGQWELGEPAP